MPRSALPAAALVALVLAAVVALLDGGRPGREPATAAGVPEPAGLPLTLSGLAFLALANRERLAARAAAVEGA